MMDNFSLDDLKDTPFAELAALVSKIKADGPNRFCVDFLRLLYFGSLRHGTAFTKDGEALELKQIGQHIPGIGGLYFLPRLAALQIGQVLFVVLRELETIQIFFKQAMKYWMDFVKKDVNRRKDEHGCDSQRTEKSGEWLDALEKDVGF
ncbi:uncharacterized protein VDAG_04861 [Verticillium dahliae VdLs.17]|uniref:Uncharacterized protein n=1 Tax=Verticillium dahliae (strain VdLs.17 / ATCC MYA-4575 / FGSC 10137) TaxID=498257 RepID=G2X376_VERDV|nr:uncharacterized protein VDAG_04861 [Verticillium dahliae VdLs.17]EGY23423.1 hypothetical protein VDAG_04861 [Verticillium dahliae VdLs.17]